MTAVSSSMAFKPASSVHPGPSRSRRATAATLAAAWTARSARSPQRTALVFEGTRWSYAALHREACQAARQLSLLGATTGDRVVLLMDNGPAFVAAFFGCQLLGVIPVPVSPCSSAERVRYLLADSEAAVVLVEPALPERIRALHRHQAYGARIVVLEPPRDACELPPPPDDADACAFIQYTSGASADSKGVVISHRAALAGIAAFTAGMGLTRRDVFSSMLPMSDHMWLVCFGLAPLLSGHMLVLHRAGMASLYPWLSAIGKHRATITGASDSLLHVASRVVEEPLRYDLSSLRLLICGSEPVTPESIETFGSRFGVLAAIKPVYGMAELTSCATITPGHEPARIDAMGHVSCGRSRRAYDVCIATDDGTLTLEPGICGEIRVRSAAEMSGYWMRSQQSAQAFDASGYVRTGDLGYFDAQGCLYVLGRMDDVVVAGGRKHSSHDVEAVARDLPEIARAAVVQSAHNKERTIAVLEVSRPLLQDKNELQRLSHSYRSAARARAGVTPSDCWFVPIGYLPCTENGKIRHASLRTWIDNGHFVPAWADTLAGFDAAAGPGQDVS